MLIMEPKMSSTLCVPLNWISQQHEQGDVDEDWDRIAAQFSVTRQRIMGDLFGHAVTKVE